MPTCGSVKSLFIIHYSTPKAMLEYGGGGEDKDSFVGRKEVSKTRLQNSRIFVCA